MPTINLLAYTRAAIEKSYNPSMGNSVHFAWSKDGGAYTALNRNEGIVFPSADISDENMIVEKGAVKPHLFPLANGGLGIAAVRVNRGGAPDPGKIVLWRTRDMKTFSEQVIALSDAEVLEVEARTGSRDGRLYVNWLRKDGRYFRSVVDMGRGAVLYQEPAGAFARTYPDAAIEGAIPGNAVSVDEEWLRPFLTAWSPVQGIRASVPESVTVHSVEELRSVKAEVIYSDGSAHQKNVEWEIGPLDFAARGKHEISGTIIQDQYRFPLAVGFADPVVFPWHGKYYFIATNDNKKQIGLYVREADSVGALFAPGARESVILDYDEEKGFIQTFWAPEFHAIGGELYILFAVGGKAWGPQSHMMRLKSGGSIMDPADWDEPIRVVKRDGSFLTVRGITLDMTYFHANNKDYLAWSYRMMKPKDSGSMLCVAAIDPRRPWQLASEPVLLSRPLYGWENNDGTINNEGPYPLFVEDMVYLAYSGGAAGGYTYAVGFLSADAKSDLLNPDNWHKQAAPALSNSTFAEEFGPGHNSFFVDRSGDVMNAYHAQQSIERGDRCTAIRRVHFGNGGAPRLDLTAEQDLPKALASVRTAVIIE